jgi:hypothetical protein
MANFRTQQSGQINFIIRHINGLSNYGYYFAAVWPFASAQSSFIATKRP